MRDSASHDRVTVSNDQSVDRAGFVAAKEDAPFDTFAKEEVARFGEQLATRDKTSNQRRSPLIAQA